MISVNELYNLFNPQYVNQDYVNQLKVEQYELKQDLEIAKVVKAVQDYCKAAKNIDQQHQQKALGLCLEVILKEFYG